MGLLSVIRRSSKSDSSVKELASTAREPGREISSTLHDELRDVTRAQTCSNERFRLLALMAVSRTPQDAEIRTPPCFVDEVDESLTDLGWARSSTCGPLTRRRLMLTESLSCHVSQRHSM